MEILQYLLHYASDKDVQELSGIANLAIKHGLEEFRLSYFSCVRNRTFLLELVEKQLKLQKYSSLLSVISKPVTLEYNPLLHYHIWRSFAQKKDEANLQEIFNKKPDYLQGTAANFRWTLTSLADADWALMTLKEGSRRWDQVLRYRKELEWIQHISTELMDWFDKEKI